MGKFDKTRNNLYNESRMKKNILFIAISIIVSILLYSCFLFPMSEAEYLNTYHGLPITRINPPDESTVNTTTPLLNWELIRNISTYHIQINTANNFTGDVIADDDTLTQSEYQVTSTLCNFQDYFWRVRVKNLQGNWLDWSKTWNFFVVAEKKITASDGESYDYYGCSVSISADGNSCIVGAVGDDNETGSVYVYKWDGSDWNESEITASDGESYDHYGCSVSISADGNSFIVGAYCDDNDTGSVYVYKWDGSDWNESKITASDGESYDYYGYSVSISADGNSFIVGAYYDDDETSSVYVYKWDGSDWNESKITASDGEFGDEYGYSVSISADGNSFIVGADCDDYETGSAYVYKWDGSDWNELKITASDGEFYDYYGRSVSISADGNSFIVSADCDDNETGSAYVYKWDGSDWNESKITASDGDSFDYYGRSVSISADGNSFIVSAFGDDDYTGSVYVYKWDGSDWNELRITASDGESYDYYGRSVSISADGNSFIVGAYYDDDYTGSAYIYH